MLSQVGGDPPDDPLYSNILPYLRRLWVFSQRYRIPSGGFQAGKNKSQEFKQKNFSGSSHFRLYEPAQFYKVSCFSTRQSWILVHCIGHGIFCFYISFQDSAENKRVSWIFGWNLLQRPSQGISGLNTAVVLTTRSWIYPKTFFRFRERSNWKFP